MHAEASWPTGRASRSNPAAREYGPITASWNQRPKTQLPSPRRRRAPGPQLVVEVRQARRFELLANVHVDAQTRLVATVEPCQRPRQEPPREGGQLRGQPQIAHRQIGF